jgi:hypothetical protein
MARGLSASVKTAVKGFCHSTISREGSPLLEKANVPKFTKILERHKMNTFK